MFSVKVAFCAKRFSFQGQCPWTSLRLRPDLWGDSQNVQYSIFLKICPADTNFVVRCFEQCAISFKAPAYRLTDVDSPVNVQIQLRRPSDNTIGESKDFQYIPNGHGM